MPKKQYKKWTKIAKCVIRKIRSKIRFTSRKRTFKIFNEIKTEKILGKNIPKILGLLGKIFPNFFILDLPLTIFFNF